MLYTKEDIAKHNAEQARVYNELADAIELIKPILVKFDGKVINVRLERAIKEILPSEMGATIGSSYGYEKRIRVNNNNRSYKANNSWNYLDYYHSDIEIDADRLNAQKALVEVDKEADRLRNEANKLVEAVANLDAIEQEYKTICEMIKSFNNKVPHLIRENYRFDRVY